MLLHLGIFFARFKLNELIYNHQFFEAINLGEELLRKIKGINENKFNKICLGAPFYWMGMAAYLIHDFQTAIYYIDASVSEDVVNVPEQKNTPSRLLLRLDGEADNQAAKILVNHAQSRVNESIASYNLLMDHNNKENYHLSIKDIQKYLLDPAIDSPSNSSRSIASTFITFFLEFDYRAFQLMIRNKPGTNEIFLIHLFKGCLLFESLLKNNPKIKISKISNLETALLKFSKEFELPNKLDIGGVTFPQVLEQSNKSDDLISTAILMTGKLRNVLGHNLAWDVTLSPEQYIDAFHFISKSCLHAISVLYR